MKKTTAVVCQEELLKRKFNPRDNLHSALTQVLGEAEEKMHRSLKRQRVVYTADDSTVKEGDQEQRVVGSRDLSIIVEPLDREAVEQRLQGVEGQMASFLTRAEVEAMVAAMVAAGVNQAKEDMAAAIQPLAASHIRNLATQVLLHAAGHQEFRETKTDYYAKLGANHPSIQAVSSDLGIKAKRFVAHADQIINRRNAAVHPGTRERLDKDIEEAQATINATPGLHAVCKWECLVVQQYAAFKAAFPQRFA